MIKKRAPWPGPRLRRFLGALWLAFFILPQAALAADGEDLSYQSPLTQADIDAYANILPLLTTEATRDAAGINQLMISYNIGKKRLVYVGAKVAIAQAMAIGALSPRQLADHNVPLYLHPSPEEVVLVNTNLHSLTLAQEKARRATAGNMPE